MAIPCKQSDHGIASLALTRPVDVRQTGQQARHTFDDIACEVPVALEYNGVSHAVMMVSPDYLTEFALGFSLSEGILHDPKELFDVQVRPEKLGYTVAMTISSRRWTELKQRRRNLTGRTGCGLCGTESLEQAIRVLPSVTAPTVTDQAIQNALTQLNTHQPMQVNTGACHGAAWCNADGDILVAREDIGRHNALDKLIGTLKQANPPSHLSDDDLSPNLCNNLSNNHPGFALISSRASVEMVQKCCTVGIGALVAVSAPTSLAIELAQQSGLLLIGFARPGRHVIYNAP